MNIDKDLGARAGNALHRRPPTAMREGGGLHAVTQEESVRRSVEFPRDGAALRGAVVRSSAPSLDDEARDRERYARSRRAWNRKMAIGFIIVMALFILMFWLIGVYGYSHGWQNPQ
jgi:hypothetical protein